MLVYREYITIVKLLDNHRDRDVNHHYVEKFKSYTETIYILSVTGLRVNIIEKNICGPIDSIADKFANLDRLPIAIYQF